VKSRRTCPDFGEEFSGEHWQRLYWSCWRAHRDQELEDDAYDRGFAAGRRTSRSLDSDLIDRAIRLCHPDRHPPERFSEAKATTARLLAPRQDLAA
jgi:hypothetical protein